MLHEFIVAHRSEILHRTRARVALRTAPHPTNEELEAGIPYFLDELVEMLRNRERTSSVIDEGATRHGSNRFAVGFTLAQVVHDYGDVCQVVTEMAMEEGAAVGIEEFRDLNRCLDDAIAGAVTEHSRAAQSEIAERNTERLGILAHELRNHLSTAFFAFQILKDGTVSIGGSTGMVLGRSLTALRDLVDRSMAEVRLDVGLYDPHRIEISDFVKEMELAGVMASRDAGVSLSTEFGDAGVMIDGDRQLLGSAVTNLLHNAFKFTPRNGHVAMRTSSTPQRVLIEIEDECGGLSDEVSGGLFKAFHQVGADRSGMGLGLLISTRAVESMQGNLRAHNRPGSGCVFTIDLPRLAAVVT